MRANIVATVHMVHSTAYCYFRESEKYNISVQKGAVESKDELALTMHYLLSDIAAVIGLGHEKLRAGD